jgi:hypothetical protein
METEYAYIVGAGLLAAVLVYCWHDTPAAAASPNGVTAGLGLATGVVTGGDPIIVSGTFGYPLPSPTFKR